MPRPKPWLKMWVEWIHDAKMLSLTLAEQAAWWRLVSLAQELAQDGRIATSNGRALNMDEIANCIHLTQRDDLKALQTMIRKMEAAGSLHWDAAVLVVTKFAKRQAKRASDDEAATAERQRQHRSRVSRNIRDELQKGPLSDSPLKNSYTEEEGEEEVTDVTSRDISDDSDAGSRETRDGPLKGAGVLGRLAVNYEQNIGLLTPRIADLFRDFVPRYRGPLEWIDEAFSEACRQNVRKWAYIEKILETWQTEGRGGKDHGKKSSRQAPRTLGERTTEPTDEEYRGSGGRGR